ncbi:response regulator [Fundidesulfovibrio terrae]|uniref:response regulator n=1 Tax=Fundidesulfovibrio terrae TaxID=2922866 RepID=UPI001FB011C0|nr:response regulator [Fundidesulfovibrio terrae]
MKHSVFIVEDNPVWCDGLRSFFESTGDFLPTAFTDPNEAWNAMLLSPPDLALIDIIMPGLSGHELAELMHDNAIPTKVIFLTAILTQEESKARGYRVGNQTVIGKPFKLDDLLSLARNALTV